MANTLKIKRGSNATVPQGQLAEPLFTTDTYDLYIGKGSGGNQRFQKYIASGTSSQFLKGDGTLDSTTYQATSEKGQNNGYASLDSGGKVPVAQLPNSIMEYLGTWDASTNTPTLANGTGNAGDVYICSVAGTVNFGAGPITFAAGDWVVYSGSIWQKSINSNSVASVNGQTGAVVLYTDDISEDGSPVNLWFTNARARTAISLTTSGTSGAATYDNSTGVLNVPNYGGALSGYLPLTGGTLTGALNGTSASFNSTVTTPAGFYIDANTYLYEGILRLTDLVNKKNILQLQATASGHYITSTFLSGGSQQAIYLSAKSTAGQNVTFNTDGTTTFSHAVNGTSSSMSSTSTATAFIPTGSTVPTNGMYLSAANTLGLSANSTKVIEISDSGRVSIGATSPTPAALTVHGAITTTNGGNITSSGMISSNSTISSGLNIIAASSITGSALVPSGTTAPTVGMYLVSGTSILNGVLGFSTGSTKRLEINNSTGDATFTNNISAANLSGTNTGDQTLSGLGGVPTTRTITINGTSFDLSANRTYSVGTIGGSGTSGYVSKFTGSTTIGNSLIYDSGSRAISIGNSSTNSWASPFYVIEGGTYGQFIGFQTNNPAFKLGTNSYFNGSNYIYTNTGYGVSILDIGSDATNAYLDFYGAPTGTAGNAATISKKFSIDNTGNAYFVESLGIGFTSGAPNGRIDFRNPANAIIVGKNTTGGTNTYSSIRLTTANSGGVGDSIGEIRGLSTNVNNRDTALTFLTSEGSAGQTEKMRITAGGNVGIGETSPSSKLHVVGSSLTNTFRVTDAANYTICMGYEGTGNIGLISTLGATASLALGTNQTARMTITGGGNVGIGTSSPAQALSIGDGTSTKYVRVQGSVADSYFGSDSVGTFLGNNSNAALYFQVNSTERMRITSGGNVGIGTTTINDKLDVYGNIRTSVNTSYYSVSNYLGINYYLGSSETTDNIDFKINGGGTFTSGGNFRWFTQTGGTTPAERMRITSGGLFKFQNNGSSYESSTSGVNEFNTAANDTNVVFRNTASTLNSARAGVDVFYANAAPNTTNAAFYQAADNAGGRTLRFEVRSNGGIANYSANNVNLASDIRLKKDITPLSSEWNKLKQLEVVNFKYKDSTDPTSLYGAIAQQVQTIYPELVIVTREATETEPEYFGIREQPFQWITTKVLQEAMAKIESLEKELDTLKNK
jgi:hypothetical protein